jgi:hypothetical protein
MAEKPTWEQVERERDEPVNIPLEPADALRGLLHVDPASEPVEDEPQEPKQTAPER